MFTRTSEFHGIQGLRLRKSLAEIYGNEPEVFEPVSVGENPYKHLDVNEIDLRRFDTIAMRIVLRTFL